MFDEDTELQVKTYIQVNPRSSIRHIAFEIGVSYGNDQHFLKTYKMHLNEIDFVQHLRGED